MRQLGSFETASQARALSFVLAKDKIEHSLEYHAERKKHEIWVHDEDQIQDAQKRLRQYRKDPKAPPFQAYDSHLEKIRKQTVDVFIEPAKSHFEVKISPSAPRRHTLNSLTALILFVCITLFTWEALQDHVQPEHPFPNTIVDSTPLQKQLLFDYPKKFELVDKMLKLYGEKSFSTSEELPPEGVFLYQKLEEQKMWEGGYEPLVLKLKEGGIFWDSQVPWLEKIQQGEYWRLITPILLHGSLLHLFMNGFLFLILAPQLESRIGPFKLILFILLSAGISNLSQYFVSGSFFMGMSGVICAMLAFIYVRQKNTPWENYLLQPMTLRFFSSFIIGMAALQVLSFFAEVGGSEGFSLGIANVAHIMGGVMGYLLGQLNFFSQAKQRP